VDIIFFSEFSMMRIREADGKGRRRFILTLGTLMLIPLAGIWNAMAKRAQKREGTVKSVVPIEDISGDVFYAEEFVIIRESGEFTVYSTRCTHLGCRLEPAGDGLLRCPCHGSEFDLKDGNIRKGPALNPLKTLIFTIHENNLIIYT